MQYLRALSLLTCLLRFLFSYHLFAYLSSSSIFHFITDNSLSVFDFHLITHKDFVIFILYNINIYDYLPLHLQYLFPLLNIFFMILIYLENFSRVFVNFVPDRYILLSFLSFAVKSFVSVSLVQPLFLINF